MKILEIVINLLTNLSLLAVERKSWVTAVMKISIDTVEVETNLNGSVMIEMINNGHGENTRTTDEETTIGGAVAGSMRDTKTGLQPTRDLNGSKCKSQTQFCKQIC